MSNHYIAPEEWRYRKLEEVCEFIADGTHFSPKSKGGPFRYVTSKNIRFGKMDLSACEYISAEDHAEIYKRCPVKFGDLLLTKDGANTGNAAINTLREPFSLLSSVAVIRGNRREVLNDFLLQYILSPRGQFYLKNEMAGLAITRLTLVTIKNLRVPIPPLPEQRKIAVILGTWDEAIALTERRIEAARQRKKGLMQRLLTGRVRFPEFARKEWQEVQLGKVFTERKEQGYEDLPLLSVTADEGIIYRDELDRRDTSSADKSNYLRVCEGNIAYNTMRMWQGRSGVSQLEGIVSPAYTVCEPKSSVDSDFMGYLFQLPSVVYLFRRYSQGLVSDTWNLKFKHFAEIRVRIPEVEEQRRIAAILQACDRESELLTKKRDALQHQKKGLMQRLLTGRVRVSV
jgi:type I restriction enzyme S subunit